jgi:hypothetical protein
MTAISRIRLLLEQRRVRRLAHRHAMAMRHAQQNVQLCEYSGHTYICVGGVPIVNTESINGDIYSVLADARQVSSTYIVERHE